MKAPDSDEAAEVNGRVEAQTAWDEWGQGQARVQELTSAHQLHLQKNSPTQRT